MTSLNSILDQIQSLQSLPEGRAEATQVDSPNQPDQPTPKPSPGSSPSPSPSPSPSLSGSILDEIAAMKPEAKSEAIPVSPEQGKEVTNSILDEIGKMAPRSRTAAEQFLRRTPGLTNVSSFQAWPQSLVDFGKEFGSEQAEDFVHRLRASEDKEKFLQEFIKDESYGDLRFKPEMTNFIRNIDKIDRAADTAARAFDPGDVPVKLLYNETQDGRMEVIIDETRWEEGIQEGVARGWLDEEKAKEYTERFKAWQALVDAAGGDLKVVQAALHRGMSPEDIEKLGGAFGTTVALGGGLADTGVFLGGGAAGGAIGSRAGGFVGGGIGAIAGNAPGFATGTRVGQAVGGVLGFFAGGIESVAAVNRTLEHYAENEGIIRDFLFSKDIHPIANQVGQLLGFAPSIGASVRNLFELGVREGREAVSKKMVLGGVQLTVAEQTYFGLARMINGVTGTQALQTGNLGLLPAQHSFLFGILVSGGHRGAITRRYSKAELMDILERKVSDGTLSEFELAALKNLEKNLQKTAGKEFKLDQLLEQMKKFEKLGAESDFFLKGPKVGPARNAQFLKDARLDAIEQRNIRISQGKIQAQKAQELDNRVAREKARFTKAAEERAAKRLSQEEQAIGAGAELPYMTKVKDDLDKMERKDLDREAEAEGLGIEETAFMSDAELKAQLLGLEADRLMAKNPALDISTSLGGRRLPREVAEDPFPEVGLGNTRSEGDLSVGEVREFGRNAKTDMSDRESVGGPVRNWLRVHDNNLPLPTAEDFRPMIPEHRLSGLRLPIEAERLRRMAGLEGLRGRTVEQWLRDLGDGDVAESEAVTGGMATRDSGHDRDTIVSKMVEAATNGKTKKDILLEEFLAESPIEAGDVSSKEVVGAFIDSRAGTKRVPRFEKRPASHFEAGSRFTLMGEEFVVTEKDGRLIATEANSGATFAIGKDGMSRVPVDPHSMSFREPESFDTESTLGIGDAVAREKAKRETEARKARKEGDATATAKPLTQEEIDLLDQGKPLPESKPEAAPEAKPEDPSLSEPKPEEKSSLSETEKVEMDGVEVDLDVVEAAADTPEAPHRPTFANTSDSGLGGRRTTFSARKLGKVGEDRKSELVSAGQPFPSTRNVDRQVERLVAEGDPKGQLDHVTQNMKWVMGILTDFFGHQFSLVKSRNFPHEVRLGARSVFSESPIPPEGQREVQALLGEMNRIKAEDVVAAVPGGSGGIRLDRIQEEAIVPFLEKMGGAKESLPEPSPDRDVRPEEVYKEAGETAVPAAGSDTLERMAPEPEDAPMSAAEVAAELGGDGPVRVGSDYGMASRRPRLILKREAVARARAGVAARQGELEILPSAELNKFARSLGIEPKDYENRRSDLVARVYEVQELAGLPKEAQVEGGRVFRALEKLTKGRIRGIKQGLDDLGRSAKAIFGRSTTLARALGRAGEDLAHEMSVAESERVRMTGVVDAQIKDIWKGVPKAGREWVGKVMNGYRDIQEVPEQYRGAVKAATERLQIVLDDVQLRWYGIKVSTVMENQGASPAGTAKKLGNLGAVRVGGKAYPQVPTKEVMATIVRDAVGGTMTPELSKVIDGIMRQQKKDGGDLDRAEVIRIVKRLRDDALSGQSPYLEGFRIRLPEEMIDWSPEAIGPRVRNAVSNVTVGQVWGAEVSPKSRRITYPGLDIRLEAVRQGHRREADELQKLIQAHFRLGRPAPRGLDAAQFIQGFEMFSKLSLNPMALLRNSLDRLSTTPTNVTPSVAFETLMQFPPGFEWLKQGAKSFRQIAVQNGWLFSADSFTEFNPGSTGTWRDLAATGFRFTEEMNVLTSGYGLYRQMQMDISRYLKMTDPDLKETRLGQFMGTLRALNRMNPAAVNKRIEDLGLNNKNPEELVEILTEVGAGRTPEEVMYAGQLAIQDTTFPLLLALKRKWWHENMAFRVMAQFKTWPVERVGFIYNKVLRQSIAERNPLPLVGFTLGAQIAGELYAITSDAITGKERSITNLLLQRNVLEGGLTDDEKDQLLSRVYRNFMSGGVLGIFGEVIFGVTDAVMGPAWASVENATHTGAHVAYNPENRIAAVARGTAKEFPGIPTGDALLARLDPTGDWKHFETSAKWHDRVNEFAKAHDEEDPELLRQRAVALAFEGFPDFPAGSTDLLLDLAARNIQFGDEDGIKNGAKYLTQLMDRVKNQTQFDKMQQSIIISMKARSPFGRLPGGISGKDPRAAKFKAQFSPRDWQEGLATQRRWMQDYGKAFRQAARQWRLNRAKARANPPAN